MEGGRGMGGHSNEFHLVGRRQNHSAFRRRIKRKKKILGCYFSLSDGMNYIFFLHGTITAQTLPRLQKRACESNALVMLVGVVSVVR